MFSSCSEFLLNLLFLKDIVEGCIEALLVLADILDCLQVSRRGAVTYNSLARGITLTAIFELNIVRHFV